MALEAFINNYGATNFSSSYFDNYLNKLDLKSKWIIIPKLVTGRQIKTKSEAFNYLINLISLRNKLVHVKTGKENTSIIEAKDWLWKTDTFEALECVKLIMNELNIIDNNVTTDWVERAKNDQYA